MAAVLGLAERLLLSESLLDASAANGRSEKGSTIAPRADAAAAVRGRSFSLYTSAWPGDGGLTMSGSRLVMVGDLLGDRAAAAAAAVAGEWM